MVLARRAISRAVIVFAVMAAGLAMAAAARAADRPVFDLSEQQLSALERYRSEPGDKAFAASAGGRFASESGLASLTVAVRSALQSCDAGIRDPRNRCIIVDVNGTMLDPALQYAQIFRIDPTQTHQPLPLADLNPGVDTWRALQGYRTKRQHKAFAMNLGGAWARAWDAASPAEAAREALAACNKQERAEDTPCFLYGLDDRMADAGDLQLMPDGTVTGLPAPREEMSN